MAEWRRDAGATLLCMALIMRFLLAMGFLPSSCVAPALSVQQTLCHIILLLLLLLLLSPTGRFDLQPAVPIKQHVRLQNNEQ